MPSFFSNMARGQVHIGYARAEVYRPAFLKLGRSTFTSAAVPVNKDVAFDSLVLAAAKLPDGSCKRYTYAVINPVLANYYQPIARAQFELEKCQ